MSVGKVTASEKCPSENCPSKKCSSEKCPSECPSENCPWEKCPSEKCPSEKCPTTWKMASHHVFVTVFLVPEILDFRRNLYRCVETQLKCYKKCHKQCFATNVVAGKLDVYFLARAPGSMRRFVCTYVRQSSNELSSIIKVISSSIMKYLIR